MWYRRALFALAVTGPAASLLVHCTEFGADGEPSTDASTTATTTSTAPPVPKADASTAQPDAAPPPGDAAAPPKTYRGTMLPDPVASAPPSGGHFVYKPKGGVARFFFVRSGNSVETGTNAEWDISNADRGLAMVENATGGGAARGLIGAALRTSDDNDVQVGNNTQRAGGVSGPYAAIGAAGTKLYVSGRTSGATQNSAICECSLDDNRVNGCVVVLKDAALIPYGFAVDADRLVLYRAPTTSGDVTVHRRAGVTGEFSSGDVVTVTPRLTGPIVGAHENGFYTTTPREGGVGFMKYDLGPAGN
jgi:hypothetical protein